MADLPPILQKESEVKRDGEQEVRLTPEFGMEAGEHGIQGEIEVINREEQDLLKEIGKLKELEIERKEDIVSSAGDDAAALMPADDPTDDDDLNIAGSLKYYGYQISKRSIQTVSNKVKGKLESSDTWLGVWLTRLLQMN